MTTLYRPVLIESAEQAEALPDDAIVIGVETGERYTRTFEGEWWGVTEMGTRLAVDLDAGDAVTALVPIEAEEEWALIYDSEDPTPCIDEVEAREWARIDGEGQTPSRRYATRWEAT